MRRVPRALREAMEARLKGRPVTVPVSDIAEGDVIEYMDLFGAVRFAHVYRIQPRAKRLVIGPLTTADLPRGYKTLVRFLGDWRRTIVESQVRGVHRRAGATTCTTSTTFTLKPIGGR